MLSRTLQPIGIFDLGSNTIRFVVFDPPYLRQNPVFNEKVQCSLGRDLVDTGKLYPPGKECTLKSINGFKALADAMNITDLHAIGTAALRDAKDGPKFIKEIKKQTGIDVRVISGEEEATLAAKGVITFFPDGDGIVGDLGGGSLELASIKKKQVYAPVSTALGVLRIKAHDDPKAYIDAQIKNISDELCQQDLFYVIGGTWRSLANLHMQATGRNGHRLSGYMISADEMRLFAKEIAAMTPQSIRNTYIVEKERAELLPAASLLMARLIKKLGFKTIIVSTTGLRDGLLCDILESAMVPAVDKTSASGT